MSYVLVYLAQSFLNLVFCYFFYDALWLIWSYKTDCDKAVIYWIIAYFFMCPVAALIALIALMKVYEKLDLHEYPMYSRGWRIKLMSTSDKWLLVPYLSIDFVHIVWSIQGVLVENRVEEERC